MKKHSELAEYLDEIFEGYNISYGAYVLRLQSWKFTLIAFLISLGFTGTLFVSPLIAEKLLPEEEPLSIKSRIINYSELSAPPPIDKSVVLPPELDELPKIIKSSLKFLPPVVKPDAEVLEEELPPSQDELKHIAAGETTIEGNDSILYDDFSQADLAVLEDLRKEKDDKTPITFAEEMPVFPGGTEALMLFIQQHLKYPKLAIDNSIQGRVFLSFVVSKTGKVDRAEVVRGLGYGCDEAALEVIKQLPKWKPARQNGENVAVKLSIPIQFVLK
jgi:protein TonB